MLPFKVELPEMQYSLQDPDELVETDDREIRCRLCKLKGREETPYHIARECLMAWRTRWEYLGGYSFEGHESLSWDPISLLKFFKHFDLENKPN